jgi:hypothetical protein
MGPVDLGMPLVVPPEAYNELKVQLARAAGICASVAMISPPAAVERLQLLEQALARCTAAVGTFVAMIPFPRLSGEPVEIPVTIVGDEEDHLPAGPSIFESLHGERGDRG